MNSNIKILLVDDGSLFCLRVLSGLKNSGFNSVEIAVNGKCMTDYLVRGKFDLIISKWSRLDTSGRELVQTLRENPAFSKIPLIMLTHPAEKLNPNDSPKDFVDFSIAKSIDYEGLGKMILETLEIRKASA